MLLDIDSYCDIDTGNACEGVQSTFALFGVDFSSVDFELMDFGLDNVIVKENEPWNISDFYRGLEVLATIIVQYGV